MSDKDKSTRDPQPQFEFEVLTSIPEWMKHVIENYDTAPSESGITSSGWSEAMI